MRIFDTEDGIACYYKPGVDRAIDFSHKIYRTMKHIVRRGRVICFLCIGSDKLVVDSLGPLVGSKLVSLFNSDLQVFGTLEHPVHATNLAQVIDEIYEEFDDPCIIAIDAAIGKLQEFDGCVKFMTAPIQPGTAYREDLPPIGDVSICGVSAGDAADLMSNRSVRLYDVMMQADFIAESVFHAYQQMIKRAMKIA